MDIILIGEKVKDLIVHIQKNSPNQSPKKKACIEVLSENIEDTIHSIVNNGKYKKFLGFCVKDGEA